MFLLCTTLFCIIYIYIVGIATDHGLDGRGSNLGGDKIFRSSRPVPGAHPASCTMGAGSFSGVVCPGLTADHSPPSSAAVMEE